MNTIVCCKVGRIIHRNLNGLLCCGDTNFGIRPIIPSRIPHHYIVIDKVEFVGSLFIDNFKSSPVVSNRESVMSKVTPHDH